MPVVPVLLLYPNMDPESILSTIKFKKRDKTVVFGGIHATVMPKEAIMYGDAVVIGEAENGLWEQVLDDIKTHKLKEFYKLDKYNLH